MFKSSLLAVAGFATAFMTTQAAMTQLISSLQPGACPSIDDYGSYKFGGSSSSFTDTTYQLVAYTKDFDTYSEYFSDYISWLDVGCTKFTLAATDTGVNAALNIEGYGDVMDGDFECTDNMCILTFNDMEVPVYLTYVDTTNDILIFAVCNQDAVTIAISLATVMGYEIDTTYLEYWNMFSSMFSTSNVQGIFAFAADTTTFTTEYDDSFSTGLS